MKERDYIGIGLAATPERGRLLSPNETVPSTQDKIECDNVELSLGLGLPEKTSQQFAHHAEQLQSPGQTKSRLTSSGAKSQHLWHPLFLRVNLSSDHYQQQATAEGVATWGVVPVPKVSTVVPAKRSYLETVGETRPLPIGNTHEATVETPAALCAMPTSTATYWWNAEGSSFAGGWQQGHGSIDQGSNLLTAGGGASSAPFAHVSQLGAVPPALPPPHFKVPPQANLPPMGNSTMGSNVPKTSPTAADGSSVKSESENDNSRNKAPVVGWPPVRSFRKNTLQATQTNRTSSEDLQMKSAGGPQNGGVDGQEPGASNSKNAFFVKAKLDGVCICRKVDLKAYGSYDALKSALQDMFQGFVSDCTKLDLLHGNNYVVTHEDKDGDCLLVGDVPWPMFVESSVKSLRIMNALDAIGIGDKVSAMLKTQANGGKP